MPDKAPGFWVRLATGNTQGHFYYVVLIVAYIPLIWLMSRMPTRWLWLVFALLVLYPLLAYHWKELRFAEGQLVRMRNPVYPAVYFIWRSLQLRRSELFPAGRGAELSPAEEEAT